MIKLSVDESAGVIRVVGVGRWTAAEVDAHFAALTAVIATVRRAGRPVRLLSDVTEAEVQSPEIEARCAAHSARLRRPGDRSAMVVKNVLLKAHVRDAAGPIDTALFCSHAAAETWLSAYDQPLSA